MYIYIYIYILLYIMYIDNIILYYIIFLSTKQEALCIFTDMNYEQYTILS